jgi:hypothetical protein
MPMTIGAADMMRSMARSGKADFDPDGMRARSTESDGLKRFAQQMDGAA